MHPRTSSHAGASLVAITSVYTLCIRAHTLARDAIVSTNVGSVYLYATTVARSGTSKYHLVKVITPPSNDRIGVACVSICPLQKHLVVGTLRGVVYGLQLSDYNKIGEKVEFSHDFHTVRPA